jgi:hypothetical protein
MYDISVCARIDARACDDLLLLVLRRGAMMLKGASSLDETSKLDETSTTARMVV